MGACYSSETMGRHEPYSGRIILFNTKCAHFLSLNDLYLVWKIRY